jgi:hypothetical protein
MPRHSECECRIHITFTVNGTVYEELQCPLCAATRIHPKDSRYHYTCDGLVILKSSNKPFDPTRPFGGRDS